MVSRPIGYQTTLAPVEVVQLDPEQWLQMYEQMNKIRAFEENANELYTSARMPGLTHLYIGEEAVAVGRLRGIAPR